MNKSSNSGLSNMSESNKQQTSVEVAFDEYLNEFKALTASSLHQQLKAKWHPQVEFKDPFNHVYEREHCVRIFEHMFEQCIDPKFRIQQRFFSGHSGSAYWTFEFRLSTSDKSKTIISGNSMIELDASGLVNKHIDYWDAAEQFYEKIPIIGALLRLVKRRLKVS